MKKALFVFLATSLVCGSAAADAIDDLPPGSWYEIPDSRIDAVFPSPAPEGWPAAVIQAWGGATLDSARERLIVWGGGHRDYAGNEVYAFSLRTLRWERLTEPSVVDATDAEAYGDGRPVSRHTYSGLVYVPTLDVLEARGGSRYQTGNGTDAMWRFHMADLRWERMANVPDWDFFGDVALFDPVTGHVFLRHNRGVYEYSPETDTYEQRFAFGGGLWQTNSSGAIDPDTRTILYIGDSVDLFHIDTGVYEAGSTFDGQSVAVGEAPGVAFDPSLHRFVTWHGGATLYSLDRAAGRWEAHVGAGTPPGPRIEDDSGSRYTFGRFRFVPSRNVYVLVNTADQNVFVYRMAEGTGSPIDPLPDAGVASDAGAVGRDGGSLTGDAGLGSTPARDGGASPSASGGCSCNVTASGQGALALPLFALALLFARRRR